MSGTPEDRRDTSAEAGPGAIGRRPEKRTARHALTGGAEVLTCGSVVGRTRVELVTSCVSSKRSNQLS